MGKFQIVQAFKGFQTEDLADLGVGKKDFKNINDLLMHVREAYNHQDTLAFIQLVQKKIGNTEYSKVTKENSKIIFNYSGIEIYEHQLQTEDGIPDSEKCFIFLSHTNWLKCESVILELFHVTASDMIVFSDTSSPNQYLYGLNIESSLLVEFKKIFPSIILDIFEGNIKDYTKLGGSKPVKKAKKAQSKRKPSIANKSASFDWSDLPDVMKGTLIGFFLNFNKRDKDEVKSELIKILHDRNIGYAGILTSIPAFMFPQPLNQFEHDFFSLYHLFVVTGRLDLIQLCEEKRPDSVVSLLNLLPPNSKDSKYCGQPLIYFAEQVKDRTIATDVSDVDAQNMIDYLTTNAIDVNEISEHEMSDKSDHEEVKEEDAEESPLWEHIRGLQKNFDEQFNEFALMEPTSILTYTKLIQLLHSYLQAPKDSKGKINQLLQTNLTFFLALDPLGALEQKYMTNVLILVAKNTILNENIGISTISKLLEYQKYNMLKQFAQHLLTVIPYKNKMDYVMKIIVKTIKSLNNSLLNCSLLDMLNFLKGLKMNESDYSDHSILEKFIKAIEIATLNGRLDIIDYSDFSGFIQFVEQEINRQKSIKSICNSINVVDDLDRAIIGQLQRDPYGMSFPFEYDVSQVSASSSNVITDFKAFCERLKKFDKAIFSLIIHIDRIEIPTDIWKLLNGFTNLSILRMQSFGKKVLRRINDSYFLIKDESDELPSICC